MASAIPGPQDATVVKLHGLPAQAPRSAAWFVSIDGVARGPLPFAALIRAIETRRVGPRAHVWHEGMAAWTRVEEIALLADALPLPPALRTIALEDEPVESTRVFMRAAGVATPVQKTAAPAAIALVAMGMIGGAIAVLSAPDPVALPIERPSRDAEVELPFEPALPQKELRRLASEGRARVIQPRAKGRDAAIEPFVIHLREAKPEIVLPEPPIEIPPIVDGSGKASMQAMMSVLDDNSSAAVDCMNRERGEVPGGRLEINVVIAPAGHVAKVETLTPAFKGTRLATCITLRMKRWRFPPFTGAPVELVAPFVFPARR